MRKCYSSSLPTKLSGYEIETKQQLAENTTVCLDSELSKLRIASGDDVFQNIYENVACKLEARFGYHYSKKVIL